MTSPYEERGDYHWQDFQTDSDYRRHVVHVWSWIKERGDALLDIGAGDGLITVGLGCKGIDSDVEAVALARAHDVPVSLGNVYDLKGEYEAVFMGDVLEHLKKPIAALIQVAKVTKKLYLATPPRIEGELHPAHVREWTPGELVEFCRMFGWIGGEIEVANARMYGVFRSEDE